MRIETPLSEIACSLVASGVGVTLCDPFTAYEYATRGIVIRPFEPRLDVEYVALYSATQRTPLLAREFIDGFRKHVVAFLRREPWRERS
jgi:DNA-binding transcriptional LysR family regulator